MNDDFEVYQKKKGEGTSAREAFLDARRAGLDLLAQIRMLRRVYTLSLTQAKELVMCIDGPPDTLREHQGTLLPALEAAFEITDAESKHLEPKKPA